MRTLSVRDPSDAELVDAFRAGHEDAFARLYERYHAGLTRYAAQMLRDRDVAEDVVQEAFLRAGRALRREPRITEVRPWLYRVVRNCALDELDRARRAESEAAGSVDSLPAASEHEPARMVERRHRVREVLSDVAALAPLQRHALLARVLDGRSHAELAHELGISEAASKGLVHRARASLAARDSARSADCAAVRADLVVAVDERRRASTRTHRHLASCSSCQAFRSQLRLERRALGLLVPVPLGLAALGSLKLASLAKPVAGGGKAAAAALAVGAAGLGTTTILAGEPSPVRISSPAVPRGVVAAGQPVPPRTAVVRGRISRTAGSGLTLACPAGFRVADLLPTEGARVSAHYRREVAVGRDRVARIVVDWRSRAPLAQVTISMLCRQPDRHGALAARRWHPAGAVMATARTRSYLRSAPGSRRVVGVVARGEPVAIVASRSRRGRRWTRVRTQTGGRGWVPTERLTQVAAGR